VGAVLKTGTRGEGEIGGGLEIEARARRSVGLGMTRRRRQRWLFALAASLVVHGSVVAVVWKAPVVEAPRASIPSEPLAEVLWMEASPKEKLPTGLSELVEDRPRAKVMRQSTRKATLPLSPTPSTVSPEGEREESDTPRAAPPLTPTVRFDPDGPGEVPGGRTLHPGDLPTEAESLADEQERVSTLVSGWARSDLGRARVRGGLVDPAYGELGSALRAATDEVPRFIDTNSVKEVTEAFAQSWSAGAERYGKTGAPYAEPEGRLEQMERPSSLVEAAARGSPDAQAMVSFFSAGARLQEFADGRAGVELYALVELQQSPSGALESVTMTRPSGLRPFDAWVMGRAREVGLAFSLDGGARSKSLRSVWRFDGVVTYRRKLKLKDLDGRALLGMATMSALSALASAGSPSARMPGMLGRFDEVTGEIDVVDLSNPKYDCRVTLLEAD
jgi:hypothetical protein